MISVLNLGFVMRLSTKIRTRAFSSAARVHPFSCGDPFTSRIFIFLNLSFRVFL